MGQQMYRRATVLVAASTALLLGVGSACGSASAPEGLGPGEASAAVARTLDLTPEQTDCLRGRFEAAPSAAAALVADEAPSDEDRDRFLAAMRACLPPEELGSTLAATLLDEVPDATAEQATCVRDNVVDLSPPEQDRLYLYFANPAGYDVDDVGQAGRDLFDACGLLAATTDDTVVDTSVDTTAAP